MKNDELIERAKEIVIFYDRREMPKLLNCIKELRLNIDRAPVTEVPCSAGLEGLQVDDIYLLKEALCLMNSMILSGEEHSSISRGKFGKALAVLTRLRKAA